MLQIARFATLVSAIAMTTGAFAESPGFSTLEPAQSAGNAVPGPRTLAGQSHSRCRRISAPPARPWSPRLIVRRHGTPTRPRRRNGARWSRSSPMRRFLCCQSPRGARRDHGADGDRRRQRVRLHAQDHAGGPPQPAHHQCAWRRLCLWPGRSGHRRGDVDGRVWRLQGDRVRLSHAAGCALSGRDGRCHGGLESRTRPCRTRAAWPSLGHRPAAA